MNDTQLNAIFAALADPTRRAIIDHLVSGEATAGELAQPFGISKPAVSKHLKILEKAKMIKRRKEAQFHKFEVLPESIKDASEWMAKYRVFWDEQLDSLEKYINNQS